MKGLSAYRTWNLSQIIPCPYTEGLGQRFDPITAASYHLYILKLYTQVELAQGVALLVYVPFRNLKDVLDAHDTLIVEERDNQTVFLFLRFTRFLKDP